MKDVGQGNSPQTGTAPGSMEKPLDQPKGKYTVNESVPRDSFHEEEIGESHENPGDMSTRYM